MKKLVVLTVLMMIVIAGCGVDTNVIKENEGAMEIDKHDRNAVEAALYFCTAMVHRDEKKLLEIAEPTIATEMLKKTRYEGSRWESFEFPESTIIYLYPTGENSYVVYVNGGGDITYKVVKYVRVYLKDRQWLVEPIENQDISGTPKDTFSLMNTRKAKDKGEH